MTDGNSPFESNAPRVHVSGEIHGQLGDAIRSVVMAMGTQNDWRNNISMPMPIRWKTRPELVGQTVIPHICHAKAHGDNEGCICHLIGQPVVITAIYETEFVGTPSYHIAGYKQRIQEREFSEYTKGKDPDTIEGYVLEGPDGKFLTAAFVWMPAAEPVKGYLHNTFVVRDLLGASFPDGAPVRAYPATYKDGVQQITGAPIPFAELAL